MGKSSKRKNKRRGGAGKHHRPTGLADDPSADAVGGTTAPVASSANEVSPIANITNKIRHGDPRVRHASLVALSSTLFDSQTLTALALSKRKDGEVGSGGKKKGANPAALRANDPTLLRALSERLLDVDVPCATAAAGCLSNYVSFYCGGGIDDDSFVMDEGGNDDDEVGVASDVLVPILLQRVQSSLGTLHSLGNQMTMHAEKQNSKSSNKKDSDHTKETAATTATAIEKLWPSFEEQWALLSLSLLTLAGLIENCPSTVLQRMGINVFPQLLTVLPLASNSVQLMSSWDEDYCGDDAMTQKRKRQGCEPILDAATNASRALHSLLDDNASLINSLPVGDICAVSSAYAADPSSFFNGNSAKLGTPSLTSAVTELTNAINNEQLSKMSRLHAAGSILSLRRVLVLERESVSGSASTLGLESCTNDVVVPMLHSLFELKDARESGDEMKEKESDNPKHLLSQMILLSQKLSKIKQDEVMESQIVQEVTARKEPAREIARRQKKTKEEEESKKKEKEQKNVDMLAMEEDDKDEAKNEEEVGAIVSEQDSAMNVEDDDEENYNDAQEKEGKIGDLKQELDDIVQSWRDLVGSYKLALEVVANLCSGKEGEEVDDGEDMDNDYDDDDEHMWDSDDEAKLVAATASGGGDATTMKCTPSEQATYDSISAQQLPEQILLFFKSWVNFVPSVTNGDSGEDVPPPVLVSQDVDDLLSTCALCLGNVVTCRTLPTWIAAAVTENGLQLFWQELVSMLSSDTLDQFKSHITSVMLSMLRNQPQAPTLVDSSTLDLLLALLSQQPRSDNSNAHVQMQCHVISMMGVRCSEPHPASVDTRVCSALLEQLRSVMMIENDSNTDSGNNGGGAARHSVIITHEVLNILMDMYGADNCHEEVFEREDVLGHFQRCLPGFKRRIKKIAWDGGRKSKRYDEEVGVWNETALNASRFIKYKKGG